MVFTVFGPHWPGQERLHGRVLRLVQGRYPQSPRRSNIRPLGNAGSPFFLAIRAFISAQSPPNRKRLLEPLRAHGIEPAAYQDEFDA